MNESKKILVMSFWTPPTVRPQSILIGKMIPEWIRQGVEPVILNYDICGEWKINRPIYSVPDYAPSKNYILRLPVFRWINEYNYYKNLFDAGRYIIKKHSIDTVFSFSNPQSSNILGAMLKKHLGIKFVSHFSDPMCDNEYKHLNKITALKTRLMERFVVKWSDKIIFTNENARKLVMGKYPKSWQERATVIPHCFDPKDYSYKQIDTEAEKPQIHAEKNPKFVISYVGAFYKERNPEIFFKALKRLKEKDKETFKKIELRLIGAENTYAGYAKKDLKALVDIYGLKENVKLIPSVDYKKSLEYMERSDCLLVIDANFKDSPYLPSKLIDYAGSLNMIIAITPKNSPTEKVVRGLGFKSFSYEETDKMTNYLKEIIKTGNKPKVNKEFLRQFNVKETTKKLLSILKNP